MVTLRFMRTTHYQVGHPLFFGFLIHSCTSANRSMTERKVMACIHRTLKNHRYKCSREATKFLVRMARYMGFLGINHIWTWKGFVINYFERWNDVDRYYEKTRIFPLSKRIIYLKYYLESDGAFLIHFARKILMENGVSKHKIRYTNKVVEPVFEDVLREYLAIERDFRKRVQLRTFLKWISGSGYQSKVRIHKAFPHLDPLVDLDIIHYNAEKHEYLPKIIEGRNMTEMFLRKFPDIPSLEGIFLSHACDYYERAAALYGVTYKECSQSQRGVISEEIVRVYPEVRDEVTGLASIKTIKDIVCTLALVDHKVLYEWPDIDRVLKELKKEKGANLRFHVDRTGEIAYIVLSE